MPDKYIALDNTGELAEISATETSTGVSNAGDIVALNTTGKIDLTLLPTGVGQDTIAIVASEALSSGDLVNIFNNSGSLRVRKADASAPNAGKKADGFVLSAVLSGETATVYLNSGGVITGLSGLTIGARYFLSAATPGSVVVASSRPTTSGHIAQSVGVALSSSELIFERTRAIILG